MKKNYLKSLLSLALVTATALTACTEPEAILVGMGRVPMKVNVANIVSTSRAIIDGETMPTDAVIGVALVDDSETTYDGTSYANVKYTTTEGSTWNTTSVPLLSATSGKAVAYYPYSETADYNAINVETASQTDYLYSTWVEGISNAAPTVNFGMEHALSAFRVLLKKTNDYNAVAKATRIQITSDAFVEQATLDATTGALSDWNGEGSVTVDIPQGGQTLTTTEQYTDIMVVPAENAGTKVKFIITVEDENGSTRDYSVEPTFTTAMLQGKCYQFTLTLSPTEMEVTNVTVTPWAQVQDAGEGTLKYYNPYLVLKYNVTSTAEATPLIAESSLSNVKQIIIDGEAISPLAAAYTFGETGEHEVKVEFNESVTSDVAKGINGFANNSGVVEIVSIPTGLKTITDEAFQGCVNLTKVNLRGMNGQLTGIGEKAFAQCAALNEIVVPEGVTTIGNYAFSGCNTMKAVTIPNSIESMGDAPFNGCDINTFSFAGNSYYIIKNGCIWEESTKTIIQAIEESATIPEETVIIGVSAFNGFAFATDKITLPNTLAKIEDKAFATTTGFTEMIIPATVTEIGNEVFNGSSLMKIECKGTTAPTISATTFQGVKSNGTIISPKGSLDAYQSWMQTSNYYLGKYNWELEEKQELVVGTIDLTTASNGVYAVAQNGLGVNVEDANSTCVAVALIVNDAPTPQRLMIEKNETNNTTSIKAAYEADGATNTGYTYFYWGMRGQDVSGITNYSNNGYLPKPDGTYQSTPNLSSDYTTWTSGCLSDFSGKANTAALMEVEDTDSYTAYANMATWCSKFNETPSENQGYSDWYIPSMGQLALIYLNKTAIEEALTKIGGLTFASNIYWSSSENSSNYGFCVYFSNGNVYYNFKNSGCRVRVVRDI